MRNAPKALPSCPQKSSSEAVWLGQNWKQPELPWQVPPILLTHEYWWYCPSPPNVKLCAPRCQCTISLSATTLSVSVESSCWPSCGKVFAINWKTGKSSLNPLVMPSFWSQAVPSCEAFDLLMLFDRFPPIVSELTSVGAIIQSQPARVSFPS